MSPGTPAEEVLITTCPRDCYDSCGIRVLKRGGAVVAVRGDPNHPVSRGTLCGKCSTAYNREWRDPKRRLTRPLDRDRSAYLSLRSDLNPKSVPTWTLVLA